MGFGDLFDDGGGKVGGWLFKAAVSPGVQDAFLLRIGEAEIEKSLFQALEMAMFR